MESKTSKSTKERGFFRSLFRNSGSHHHHSSHSHSQSHNTHKSNQLNSSSSSNENLEHALLNGTSDDRCSNQQERKRSNPSLKTNGFVQVDREGNEKDKRSITKYHSFSHFGHKDEKDKDLGTGTSSNSNSLLSKRPNLIIPFSNNPAESASSTSNGTSHGGIQWSNYLEDFHSPTARSGVLIKQANHLKTWKKRLMVLKGQSLFYYVSGGVGEGAFPRGVIPLVGACIVPVDPSKFKKQNCFEISQPGYRPIYLMAKSDSDATHWMSSLLSASLPMTVDKRNLLLLTTTSSVLAEFQQEQLNSLGALDDTSVYRRVYVFRQKMALCVPLKDEMVMNAHNAKPSGATTTTENGDSKTPGQQWSRTVELFNRREKRLQVLFELNHCCESQPSVLSDPLLYRQLLFFVGTYLFRALPLVPTSFSPSNVFVEDNSMEEGLLSSGNSAENGSDVGRSNAEARDQAGNSGEPGSLANGSMTGTTLLVGVEEQQWALLSSCYDLLQKAIEQVDQFEKAARKEFFSLRFLSQLVNLFRSPSFKERQVLKSVLHRLYYKLTQRRSAIRREIAHVFYEYIYETSNHAGVAELLEILGSIVNGFACPIKAEHIVLLKKALIPLHSTTAYIAYHQQLAYCMLQYVAKDHSLFQPIVRGLLRYWPCGNSFKEVVFLVELEELMEHVLSESDFDGIAKQVARRLGSCMVSDQFQVAERAFACWCSPGCLRIMNSYEQLAREMTSTIQPFVQKAYKKHWNAIIQQKAQETLTLYTNMGYFTESESDSDEDQPTPKIQPQTPPMSPTVSATRKSLAEMLKPDSSIAEEAPIVESPCEEMTDDNQEPASPLEASSASASTLSPPVSPHDDSRSQ